MLRRRSAPPARKPRTFPRLEVLEARDVPATLLVDDDFTANTATKFRTIQAAVDASHTGDTILVAQGVYAEQVTVPADKDRITLTAKQPRKAVIEAPATLSGTNAIVRVAGAEGVTVTGFTITGDADWGVQVDAGGSALITKNLITGVRNDPLDGAQTGVGVLVGGRSAEGSTPATAMVVDNTIEDYQKGGVVVVNDKTFALVSGNDITGAGPTDLIAQNGVQVSRGADAVVSGNKISKNDYTGDDAEAAGVIVFEAGRVSVAGNRLTRNQDGVLVVDTDGVSITGNRVEHSSLDGIILSGADNAVVSANRVDDTGRDGIVIEDGSKNVVTDNRVDDSGRYGIAVTGASSGNVISFNRVTGSGTADTLDTSTGPNTWFGNELGKKGSGNEG